MSDLKIDRVVDEISQYLVGIGIQESASLERLLSAGAAVFLRRPRLRVAEQFDFAPDSLIYDKSLRVLGCVHVVDSSDTDVADQVEKMIDASTFLRHLLLTYNDKKSALPCTIELVIAAEESAKKAFGESLRHAVEEYTSLQSIGINLLWVVPNGSAVRLADPKRAFSWLLRRTGDWFSKYAYTESFPAARLAGVALENFRLSGRREIDLRGRSRFHIVHGFNGSGKTSLSEALELVVTGSIERLVRAKDSNYDKAIRHNRSTAPARVVLSYESGPEPYEVVPDGLAGGTRKGVSLRSLSFRFDQSVMERMSRGGDSERTESFLGAFFPEDERIYLALRSERRAVEAALSRLPTDLRGSIESNGTIEARLNAAVELLDLPEDWTSSEGQEVLARWLPTSLENLRRLSPFAPGLSRVISRLENQASGNMNLDEIASDLDAELRPVISSLNEKLATIRTASRALERLKGWSFTGGTETREDNPVNLLNSWLEYSALSALAETQLQLAVVLRDAQETGQISQELNIAMADGLFGQPPSETKKIEALRENHARWSRQRDDFSSKLESVKAKASAVSTSKRVETPQLTPGEISSLDTVAGWYSQAEGKALDEPLGQAIATALRDNRNRNVGSLIIGSKNWQKPILSWLLGAAELCEELLAEDSLRSTTVERFGVMQALIGQAERFRDASEQAKTAMLQRIEGELKEALWELVVYLTPARWAYEEIKISYVEDGDGGRLALEVGDENARADTRLNMAELNIVTLALFFLCAVRMKNPLFLLVLDDPFQNMDELTRTYVARGLAKLGWLLPEPWRVLILLHGEDDFACVSDELPATVHRLPWLVPDGAGIDDEPATEVRKGKSEGRPQLEHLLKETPKVKRKSA
ncbi:MAG TPA: ATP-binding protein [Thermoanaerobaculia bacterium]|jgi:hypothetical protein|nr:ATP-binding protein [Thermoanaerobaculia bacterium]